MIKPQLIMKSTGMHYPDDSYNKIPAWSLSRLLDLLPDGITIPDENEENEYLALDLGSHYSLQIEKSDSEGYTLAYRASNDDTLFIVVKDDLVSAIVKTLEWIVKEQGWTAQALIDFCKEQ